MISWKKKNKKSEYLQISLRSSLASFDDDAFLFRLT